MPDLTSGPPLVQLYGLPMPMTPWECEMQAFRWGLRKGEHGSRGRYEHLLGFLKYILPRDVCQRDALVCPDCIKARRMLHKPRWNPWTERTLRELCNDDTAIYRGNSRIKTTILSGCASAGKTHTCGLYAWAWWIVAPFESTVMLTSTTKDQVRRRIWPVIQYYHDHTCDPWTGGPLGYYKKIDSQTTINYAPPDGSSNPKCAIFAMAVAEGETQKAATNLRGLHNRRMLLIPDEMNATPEAIMETIPNQLKGCEDHQVIGIGNPISHLDTHGQASRPVQGWKAVQEDVQSWPTAGVDKWELEPGMCLRYDGKDSPNVRAGEDIWPFLYSQGNWARACDPKFEKTLMYWSQSRGLWPPEGTCKTILSETALAKYDPEDGPPFRWLTRKRIIGFLDPAFGGDDCMLYFAELGDIEGGKDAIQITHAIALTFEAASQEERDHIIARQAIEECRLRAVAPEDFGIDRTGSGRGVAAIICAEWSNSIQQVEFGQLATERPSSTADNRPAREVFSTFVTEMWWGVREFLEAGQLRGIPAQARIELTSREYDVKGRKFRMEPKPEFKSRFGFSPDDGDCVAGLVEVARRRGINPQTPASRAADQAWDNVLAAHSRDAEDDAQEDNRPHPEMFEQSMDDFQDIWAERW